MHQHFFHSRPFTKVGAGLRQFPGIATLEDNDAYASAWARFYGPTHTRAFEQLDGSLFFQVRYHDYDMHWVGCYIRLISMISEMVRRYSEISSTSMLMTCLWTDPRALTVCSWLACLNLGTCNRTGHTWPSCTHVSIYLRHLPDCEYPSGCENIPTPLHLAETGTAPRQIGP